MLDSTPRHDSRLDEAQGDERFVCCRACHAAVARSSDRVVIGTGDLHTFVNPSGDVFELALFSRADGASAFGHGSLEYTWFPGHAWRFAVCRSCGMQLGWHYEGLNDFWGLIRAALRWD